MTATPTAEDRPYLRIDYVARTGNGRIIDTTDPSAAAESDLADVEASGPVVVVPGEGHLFDPLEAAVSDAEPGQTVEMTVEPEDAFGTHDPDQTATIGTTALAPDNREPGATVDLGGRRATVEDVSEETVTVDFNHPLAGVALEYEIEVLERVEGTEERTAGLATTHGLRDVTVEYDAETATLTVWDSLTEPSADRDSRLRAYVVDVRRLLDIDTVRIHTEYPR
jgi:FKBP-type peptidyl-prolyl cis-trans isomerase 2